MQKKFMLATLFALLPSVSAQASAASVGMEAPGAGATATTSKLFDSARAGDLQALRDVLAEGTDTSVRDDRGNTPLILAAYYGNGSAVEALLLAGADPNAGDSARGNTALMGAVFKGDGDVARRLIAEPRTDVNAKNKAGQTAAMFAALFGRTEILDALVARGADLEAADANGYTAEKLALQQGNDELADRIHKLKSASASANDR